MSWVCVPVFLRFGKCEGQFALFWSQGTTVAVRITLPNRAQVHRWAGNLFDTVHFQMSMESFSQTPR